MPQNRYIHTCREIVILRECEIVRSTFRGVDKDKELAPYALFPNNYEGCDFCDRNCDYPFWKMSKSPYTL